MMRLKSPDARSLRLLLAGLMLLAALAAGRLMGEAAGRHAVAAAIGVSLCSGDVAQADPQPGETPHHTDCTLCALPAMASAPAPESALRLMARVVDHAARRPVRDSSVRFAGNYQSRAPPQGA